MADTTVYNQYDARFNMLFDDGEVNDEPDMCDPIGYEPFEQQIQDLLNSGQNLVDYFEQTFPNEPPETDETLEQSMLPRYMDFFDTYDKFKEVNVRLKQQKDAAELAAQAATQTPPSTDTQKDTSGSTS
jgi:hypothetical protein